VQEAAPVSSLNRYSNLKALRHPERIIDIRRDPASARPMLLQLVLSDYCNQSCSFCTYRNPQDQASALFHEDGNYNPRRMIAEAKALEILDDAKRIGVRAIEFTGGGEPTAHPRFQRIFDRALELGFEVGLITNGILLHRLEVARASWIRISIDASNAATYAAVRRVPPAQFERAMAQVERFRCGVGFVMTDDNWTEVLDAVRLFKRRGASNVRIAPEFRSERALPFFESALGLVGQAIAESEPPRFIVHSRFVEKHEEVQTAPTEALCGRQYFTTWIGADLSLYRCCITAYNERGFLGSLKDARLLDLWPRVAADFHRFDARGCVGCHYRDVNSVLAYVLADSTADENFV
jgi:hypothetical protein